MRVSRLNERDAVIEIVNTGKLKIDKDNLDISIGLEANSSKEYRKEDLDYKVDNTGDNRCKVYILPCGSGDVPFRDEFINEKVCILNFASSRNPGGGFMKGANAQEENLCYHSNLYDILSKHKSFYEFNNSNLRKSLYTDGIVYSRNVLFFRKNFKNVNPKLTDVITCAAPNRGAALRNGVSEIDIERTMSRRLEQIIKVAIENDNRILVLGAFGCGVFKNKVEFVAKEIRKLLFTKGYGTQFDSIIIPTLTSDGEVYNGFKEVFKGTKYLVVEE